MSELDKLFLKPGVMPDGTPMTARKPMGGLLAAQGEWIVLDSHWRRRLADGDVVEATPPQGDPETPTTAAPVVSLVGSAAGKTK